MKTIEIKCCCECPFKTNYFSGHRIRGCNLSKKTLPNKTPDWCELRNGVTLKIK